MLDKYQQEIVNSNEPRIIVEAGAGSRKDFYFDWKSKTFIIRWGRTIKYGYNYIYSYGSRRT